MYGLVNRALQQMICARCGNEGWQSVRHRAGIEDEVFVRMDSYPDEITERLLESASKELARPPENCSKTSGVSGFGTPWSKVTVRC